MRTYPPRQGLALVSFCLFALLALVSCAAEEKVAPVAKPALTVTAVSPRVAELPLRVAANGTIAAWQETSIGAESSGLRLAEVRVNVGDEVQKGQVLAVFAAETVQADLAEARANLAEAQARLEEARANVIRSRDLQAKGFISSQKVTEYLTAESTAVARVDAQHAVLGMRQVRVKQATVVAPDYGVIVARSAAVGAVAPAGQELFRLIRQGRLEWRAEVAAADLSLVRPGIAAVVTPAGGAAITGKVRMIAPTVDAQTRNGIVYVDLPAGKAAGGARAGMFARGEFDTGAVRALILPQSAVVLRDGFSYVLQIGGDARVRQLKIATGRRSGDVIEITGGLDVTARVVAAGGAFLADGDTVRVVDAAPAAGAR